jgi:hypothetical protein
MNSRGLLQPGATVSNSANPIGSCRRYSLSGEYPQGSGTKMDEIGEIQIKIDFNLKSNGDW